MFAGVVGDEVLSAVNGCEWADLVCILCFVLAGSTCICTCTCTCIRYNVLRLESIHICTCISYNVHVHIGLHVCMCRTYMYMCM